MAELAVITWLWGDGKYGGADVARLQRQVRKNLRIDHSFHVFSDKPRSDIPPDIDVRPIRDLDLCDRSCFCRLRMFDPVWQRQNHFHGWILSLDLDIVITGSLAGIFDSRTDTFKILRGANSMNPNPFNGSVMMLKAGCHPEVWTEFSREAASKIKHFEFPDDQGWIWHMLPNAAGWQAGRDSGIYGFKKPGWPHRTNELPTHARMVCFIGHRKPEHYPGVSWIKQYWTEA